MTWAAVNINDDIRIERVRAMVQVNRRLTIREISEEMKISKSSCQTILTKKLNTPQVATKFIPWLLAD